MQEQVSIKRRRMACTSLYKFQTVLCVNVRMHLHISQPSMPTYVKVTINVISSFPRMSYFPLYFGKIIF